MQKKKWNKINCGSLPSAYSIFAFSVVLRLSRKTFAKPTNDSCTFTMFVHHSASRVADTTKWWRWRIKMVEFFPRIWVSGEVMSTKIGLEKKRNCENNNNNNNRTQWIEWLSVPYYRAAIQSHTQHSHTHTAHTGSQMRIIMPTYRIYGNTSKCPKAAEQGSNISWNYNLFARSYRSEAQHVEMFLFCYCFLTVVLWYRCRSPSLRLKNFSTDDLFCFFFHAQPWLVGVSFRCWSLCDANAQMREILTCTDGERERGEGESELRGRGGGVSSSERLGVMCEH